MPRIPVFKLGQTSQEMEPPQLSRYTPSLSLEGLQLGIDNLRHDVHLSPRFVEQARLHIARLIVRFGNVEGLLAVETDDIAQPNPFIGSRVAQKTRPKTGPSELKPLLAEIHVAALNRAKATENLAVDMLARFNQQGGVVLDKKWFEEEFKTRPVWTIPGQLELLARKDGKPSTVDGWFSAVGDYFIAAGTLKEKPDPTKFIIDEFMKKAAGGPKR